MFNFNTDQLSSLFRSVLKIGGTASVCLGAVDPQWGAGLQAILVGIGGVGTGLGLFMSHKAAKKA